MKLERDMNIYSWMNNNFVFSEKPDYEFVPFNKKYKSSYADIHNVIDLISVGNVLDDVLIIPEYQRDLVWTLKQKQDLILSMLLGNPIGEFIFKIDRISSNWTEYTIIDGQQRMNTIKSFFNSEFPLEDGRYISDLKAWDVREFLTSFKIVALSLKGITKTQEIEIYLNKNVGGTAHTKEEIQKAKNFLKK